MRMLPCNRPGLGALVGLLLLPVLWAPASTQEEQETQPIVSSRVSVASDDASLHLELADDSEVEIALRDGDVVVDGETVGSYETGAGLDSAWRTLLGEAVSLSDGPLARALRDWEPPAGLDADAAGVAERIDRVLEERLSTAAPERTPATVQAEPGDRNAIRELLRRSDDLRGLAEAIEGLSLGQLQIRVDEDVVVGPDERIDGTLVVVDGDLDVRGEVDGDVILTDGELRVREGGRIDGTVRLVNARVFREGGEIAGDVRNVSPDDEEWEAESLDDLRDRIRDEVRHELRDELRSELRRELRGRGSGVLAPLRNVGRGIAGLLQYLVSLAITGVLAVIAIHFFKEKLDVVAESVRRNPGRGAVVGVAGAFLLLPAWILGMVALAISIIGIPALIAWIPLFPLAAGLAAGFGYLAAARVVGQWIAEQRFQGLDFLRPSNTVHTVLAGIIALTLPFAAAHVVSIAGPWLDFVEGLLNAVGVMAGVAALTVGFGSVLVTRAGRRTPYGPGPDPYDVRWPGEPAPDDAGTGEVWDDLESRAERRTAGEPPPEAGAEPETGSDAEDAPVDDAGSGDDVGADDADDAADAAEEDDDDDDDDDDEGEKNDG